MHNAADISEEVPITWTEIESLRRAAFLKGITDSPRRRTTPLAIDSNSGTTATSRHTYSAARCRVKHLPKLSKSVIAINDSGSTDILLSSHP